jgi:hypothetical protein
MLLGIILYYDNVLLVQIFDFILNLLLDMRKEESHL